MPRGVQGGLEPGAVGNPHDVEMMDVPGVRGGQRGDQVRAGQQLVVEGGGAAAGLIPRLQTLEFDPQDRGLDRVEPAVEPVAEMLVFDLLAVVAQEQHLVGQLGPVGGDRPGVAKRAQVLARVKAEGGRVSPREPQIRPL